MNVCGNHACYQQLDGIALGPILQYLQLTRFRLFRNAQFQASAAAQQDRRGQLTEHSHRLPQRQRAKVHAGEFHFTTRKSRRRHHGIDFGNIRCIRFCHSGHISKPTTHFLFSSKQNLTTSDVSQ